MTDITALLTAYDEAFQRQFGERAPIVAGKDAKLAADLLKPRMRNSKASSWVDGLSFDAKLSAVMGGKR